MRPADCGEPMALARNTILVIINRITTKNNKSVLLKLSRKRFFINKSLLQKLTKLYFQSELATFLVALTVYYLYGGKGVTSEYFKKEQT